MKKMHLLKTLGVSLGIISLACGLGACGKSQQAAESASSTSNNKKVTVTFWESYTGVYQQSMNKMVDEFNKSQDKYKVVCTSQSGYTGLNQKIMAAAKANSLPTIAQATYPTVPDYVKNGWLVDLTSRINNEHGLVDDLYPAFLKNTKYQGKYYSVPFSESLDILYYNKTLMDKYGLQKPDSWEDLQKDAQILKEKHANVALLQLDKSFDQEYQSMLKELGTDMVSPDSLKVNIDSNNSKEAANFFMNMINDHSAVTSTNTYGDDDWLRGSAVFYANTSAGLNHLQQNVPLSFKWGTLSFPSYHGKRASILAGSNLVMFKSASKAQQDGAWAFMKFLMSKPQTTKWAEMTGYLPLRKSAANSKEYQQYLQKHPVYQAVADTLPYGFEQVAFPGYAQFRNQELTSFSNMINKQQSVNQALATLQTKTEQIIKENK